MVGRTMKQTPKGCKATLVIACLYCMSEEHSMTLDLATHPHVTMPFKTLKCTKCFKEGMNVSVKLSEG